MLVLFCRILTVHGSDPVLQNEIHDAVNNYISDPVTQLMVTQLQDMETYQNGTLLK